MSEAKNSKSISWWEFYLVRYLIGTIIGAIILYVLLSHFQKSFLLEYKDVIKELLSIKEYSKILLLLAGGFALTYIASSPVLILHAIRLKFNQKQSKRNEPKLITWVSGFILFLLGILCASLFYYLFKVSLITGLISLIISIPFMLLLYYWISEVGSKKIKIKDLYLENVKSREVFNPQSYIDSYRHLREHGNAFFILCLEILIGIALYSVSDLIEFLSVLSIWIMPPVLIWFFANYLESILTGKSDKEKI